MDCVAGANLDKKLLTTADLEHQRHFYLQLVDILAQLRKLGFPRIGSLVPPSTVTRWPSAGVLPLCREVPNFTLSRPFFKTALSMS